MLNVAYHGQPVGRLVEGSGRIFFEYDPQWLAQGHDLSPLHLPRKPGVQYYHADSPREDRRGDSPDARGGQLRNDADRERLRRTRFARDPKAIGIGQWIAIS